MVERLFVLCALSMSTAAAAGEALVSPTQSAEESEARQRSAEDSFLNIIAPQNMDFDNAVRSRAADTKMPSPRRRIPALNDKISDDPYASPNPTSQTPLIYTPEGAAERSVTLSLEDYAAYQEKVRLSQEESVLREGPAVILAASEYTGKALPGALSLHLKLEIILGAGNKWKTVPLVGEDVVLTSARVDNKLIPTARQNGYLVWATRRTGDIVVEMDILVPSLGPRGSIEYDFFAPKTPVTRFSCFFPTAGLEPRIADARQSSALPRDDGTFFEAVLKPTSRIHFVGYKDIGTDEDVAAGLFTETLNLVSIDAGVIDLFSVFRYTILYAGAKEFLIEIPKDMTVVSAEGESAFSFELESTGDKTVLRGETAFPVRNNFEISLRLKRRYSRPETAFDIPLPHALNAVREHGYIAVEAPGKLQIEEKEKHEVTTLDIRQLPEEMLQSAVSPVIRAYRFHNAAAKVTLTAVKLPEKEPESGSIDRIRAFSVISKDGKMLTDMRIRMRNRLRPLLTMNVPDGVKLLSVHLDGEAVQPSRESKHRVILPLKRSDGDEAMLQFSLQVVMESRIDAPGLFGRRDLALPSVDMPVSSADWTVYAPSQNAYASLVGALGRQVQAGEAGWYASPFSSAPVRTFAPDAEGDAAGPTEGSGIAAVRIDIPKTGTRLDWAGYWINANAPVAVHFYFVRSRLLVPVGVLLVLGFAFGALLLFSRSIGRRIAGALIAATTVYPLYKVFGQAGIEAGVLLFLVVMGYRRRVISQLGARIKEWRATLGARYHERNTDETNIKIGRVLAGLSMGVVGFFLLIAASAFVNLLLSPL